MKNLFASIKFKRHHQEVISPDYAHLNLDNLRSFENFKKRLAVEKRRSERLNFKSSIIIIKLKNEYHKQLKFYEDLIQTICANLRATDDVCISPDNTILILLPDTNNIEAKYVSEKMINKILTAQNKQHLTRPFINNEFDVEILSYPEDETNKQLSLNQPAGKPNFLPGNNQKHEKSSSLKRRQLSCQTDHFVGMKVCINSSNGSALALQLIDNFFWDNQFAIRKLLQAKLMAKRLVDLIGATIGLLIFLPIMCIIAIMIKITSSGPIFFKQKRIGYRGQPFSFIKFRTMYPNCDSKNHQEYVKKYINRKHDEINNGSKDKPVYKMKNDPRITPVGKFIRKTSLDELPQLWNVIRGEMSLVGPRPPISYEVNEYKPWHYRRLMEMKPGITGLWQVSGRNNTTFDEMVRLDLEYARNWSLLLDTKIICKTVRAVINTEGT